MMVRALAMSHVNKKPFLSCLLQDGTRVILDLSPDQVILILREAVKLVAMDVRLENEK